MFTNLGFHGKGMVAIPDVSGLSLTAAQQLITSSGLKIGSAYSIGNSRGASSANNNLAAGARLQTYTCDSDAINCNNHGLLVDYETTIDLDSYLYVAPTTAATTAATTQATSAPGGGGTSATQATSATPAPPTWTWGPCETYQVTYPQCNGEDVYNAIWEGTRKKRSDGEIYEVCTSPTWTGVWGGCIATNNSGCGGSGGAGTSPCVTPAPTITYGTCQNAGIYEVEDGCNGTNLRIVSYRARHAPIYSNGVATGTYEDSVCADTYIKTDYVQYDGICGYQSTTAGTTAGTTAATSAPTKWCNSLGEYIGINDYCPGGGTVATTAATTAATTEATAATTAATSATTAATAACGSPNTYAGCICNGGIWRSAGCMI